jgi:hypothetical protein
MASLVVHGLAFPRSRGTLGGVGTPRELTELTNGAPCLGVALGISAVAFLLA